MTQTPDAARAPERGARRRLGDVLVDRKILTDTDLERALATQGNDQPQHRRRLGRVLMDLGLVNDVQLASALAEAHGLPVHDLQLATIDPVSARIVPRSVAERHCVLVLGWQGRRLRVAVADPVDVVALDDVRALAGATGLEVGVAPERQIRKALDDVWGEVVDDEVLKEFLSDQEPETTPQEEITSETDAAAIRMVDRFLSHGVRLGASDIHVEPGREGMRVRMRVDGILRDVLQLPMTGYGSLIARLKIISGLNVIERRVPQDGRTRIAIDGRKMDVRVSTLPSLRGEKVVLRLLPHSTDLPTMSTLGLEDDQVALLRSVVEMPQGFVLITGPTGSGKTNTLYAALHDVVRDDRNVITLEDPVEIELPGTTQVQIDDRIGMTFARGLRAVLRQDPDVVLVGEIRDLETAELAVRAALTGHLVLSTLHTMDSPAALTRLLDMDVPAYLVASSLSLVMSQRLVRVPCEYCAVEKTGVDAVTASRLGMTEEEQAGTYLEAIGCVRCDDIGYRGRTGIFETLPVTPAVRRALLRGGTEETVREAALAEGFRPLTRRGVEAALQHRTTLSEVLRVAATAVELT
ncbi:MAG: ATPase, T2SS/T4P/T4SS family [Candidatus Nanopelagicales bacterium]